MNDLLTTRQVQNLLKVDRITIYRMLQDGRLTGVKIGQQWRFTLNEVQRLVNGGALPETSQTAQRPIKTKPTALPTHCIQLIQNMFSEMGQVSVVVVDRAGTPLTRVSQPCAFCQLLQSSPSGMQSCRDSWRELAASAQRNGGLSTGWRACHAGLQYLATPILENDSTAAVLLTGQFYTLAPDPEKEKQSIAALAYRHQLDAQALVTAARAIPVLSQEKKANLTDWRFSFTRTIESILNERAGLVDRLQQISRISQLSLEY